MRVTGLVKHPVRRGSGKGREGRGVIWIILPAKVKLQPGEDNPLTGEEVFLDLS